MSQGSLMLFTAPWYIEIAAEKYFFIELMNEWVGEFYLLQPSHYPWKVVMYRLGMQSILSSAKDSYSCYL